MGVDQHILPELTSRSSQLGENQRHWRLPCTGFEGVRRPGLARPVSDLKFRLRRGKLRRPNFLHMDYLAGVDDRDGGDWVQDHIRTMSAAKTFVNNNLPKSFAGRLIGKACREWQKWSHRVG